MNKIIKTIEVVVSIRGKIESATMQVLSKIIECKVFIGGFFF